MLEGVFQRPAGKEESGGEDGIRTHGAVKHTRFPVVPIRPL